MFLLKNEMVRLTEFECHSLCRDAAHTVHPLAGQGLNQGLADVECLARVIEQSLLSGSDIGKLAKKLQFFRHLKQLRYLILTSFYFYFSGNIHSLTPYSSERFLPNLAMLGTVDKLSKLYNTDFGPVVWARSLGLTAVDNMGPIKTEIMRFAMGLEDVPSSSRR